MALGAGGTSEAGAQMEVKRNVVEGGKLTFQSGDDILGFTPALDYIVVKESWQDEKRHVTVSDEMIRQRHATDGHIWGKVVAVGPGRSSEYTGKPIVHRLEVGGVAVQPVPCHKGDEVLYSLGAGTQIGEHRFLLPRDILARR